jgi:hypothetical protein
MIIQTVQLDCPPNCPYLFADRGKKYCRWAAVKGKAKVVETNQLKKCPRDKMPGGRYGLPAGRQATR